MNKALGLTNSHILTYLEIINYLLNSPIRPRISENIEFYVFQVPRTISYYFGRDFYQNSQKLSFYVFFYI
jgi:hypothetical protein